MCLRELDGSQRLADTEEVSCRPFRDRDRLIMAIKSELKRRFSDADSRQKLSSEETATSMEIHCESRWKWIDVLADKVEYNGW